MNASTDRLLRRTLWGNAVFSVVSGAVLAAFAGPFAKIAAHGPVALMGLAANFIAKYIDRYRWIAWFGLIVILWVAGKMIYEGFVDHDVGLLNYLWPGTVEPH